MTNNPETNWAGNQTFRAAHWHRPQTIDQLQALVARSDKIKAVGTRHSFNRVADTPGHAVSLEHFTDVEPVDVQRRTVSVGAGVRYGDLCRQLDRQGYALHNLASLPHISVAGACATATHGSGDGNGNLATAVASIEMVAAGGELVRLSRKTAGDELNGAVVGLGGPGVVTKLELDVLPAFDLRQDVYERLPSASFETSFDDITASGYSVSLFTNWRTPAFNQLWIKRRVTQAAAQAEPGLFGAAPRLFGANLATAPLHPIASLDAVNCTEQMGRPGPSHERLPHFRMDFTPSSGQELQTEYFVPRTHILAAWRALQPLRERIAALIQISEIRTIAADDLWMSPCYQRASVAIHFTWKKDWPAVQQLLPHIEARLAPFQARPHWGKLFTLPAARLQSLYPKLPDFRQLLQNYDPAGKFRNQYLDTYIFGT